MTCYIHEVALSISHKCSTSETTGDVTQVYKMLISSSMEQKFKVRQVGVDMSSGFVKKNWKLPPLDNWENVFDEDIKLI